MGKIPFRAALALALLTSTAGCVSSSTRKEFDDASRALTTAREREPRATSEDEESLAREPRLDVVMRVALARSPALAEDRERVYAGYERARSLSHLPDPEIKYELWGQPLARPYALGEANAHLLGVRQAFPAPGSLDARSRAALEDAKLVGLTRAGREQDVTARTRRAYATFYQADREKKIHLGHVAVLSELVDLARANYAVGKGSQQDVLRIMVELSRLHSDVSVIDQQLASSRAELNALMGRPGDAPLGPPADPPAAPAGTALDALERDARARRPEAVAALTAIRRSEALRDDAQSRGRWPSFMVGLDYWLMPTQPEPHAFGAMVSMSVPWLNPAHGEETRAAEHALKADQRSVSALESTFGYELRDAAARLEAARQQIVILERDLLPQARASFESARASFAVGATDTLNLLDAFRSYLDVRLEHVRALARAQASVSAIERAAGGTLQGTPGVDRAPARAGEAPSATGGRP